VTGDELRQLGSNDNGKDTNMDRAEQTLRAAESVREAVQIERKLRRLDAKIAAGHTHLSEHRDAVASKLAALTGGGR
jgi:hypothetical protein